MRIPAPNHTQTPNDLFDHWLPLLSEGELKVLLVIMRKTFGWHKTHDAISASQLSKYTGMLEETVIKAARSLQSKGVITREVVGPAGKQQTIYSLIVTEDSNNSYPSVDTPPSEPRGPLGLNPPVQTEAQKKPLLKETIQKKQQHEQPAAASFYKELKDLDIPIADKIEVTKNYPIENVRHALLWLAKNDKPLTRGVAAALKWACKVQPSIPEPKKVEKIQESPEAYNRNYYRQINTVASQNGIRLHDIGLRDGNEYLQTEHDKLYFKDRSFLEQIANFLRKRSVECRNVFDMIRVCQADLVKQLC